MSSKKSRAAASAEPTITEEQPPHGGSFMRNPDGTLALIERTELLGPGDTPADDEAADDDDGLGGSASAGAGAGAGDTKTNPGDPAPTDGASANGAGPQTEEA